MNERVPGPDTGLAAFRPIIIIVVVITVVAIAVAVVLVSSVNRERVGLESKKMLPATDIQ